VLTVFIVPAAYFIVYRRKDSPGGTGAVVTAPSL